MCVDVCVCVGLMCCGSNLYIETLYMHDWREVLCVCVFVVWYDYSE